MQRLRNIARNQQVLEGLGLVGASLGPPAGSSRAPAAREESYPPGTSGAAPSRRSNRGQAARNYADGEPDEDQKGDDELRWTLQEIQEAADADE